MRLHGIVAGKGQHEAVVRQAVATHVIRADGADGQARGGDGQEFVRQIGSGSVECACAPLARGNVHHVGAAAVAGVNADEPSSEQAGDIRADQADIRWYPRKQSGSVW